MALAPNFDDLTYGDETRRFGDYVGLPHDEADDGVPVGQAVHLDGTDIAAATGSSDPVVGVLYTYRYTGDSGGPADPGDVQQDAPATVKTKGTVKAEVESGVSAGDGLEAGTSTNGVFDTAGSQANDHRAVALSDAKKDDRPDGTTAHYADVLLL
jgi:hypothetical protein